MPQFVWANAPTGLRNQVMACAHVLRDILEDGLTGIYLHGSLALGGFNPQQSDINLMVVVRQSPDPEALWATMRSLVETSGQPYPYEVVIIREAHLFPWRYPVPYAFHYDESHRIAYEEMIADDVRPVEASATHPDIAMHIASLHAGGVTLIGQEIEFTFPNVPHHDYIDAILRDTHHARDNLLFDPVYAVLSLTRVYRFLFSGQVTSKDSAGEWMVGRLTGEFREIVACMLAYYRGETNIIPFDPVDVAQCVAYLDAKVTDRHMRLGRDL